MECCKLLQAADDASDNKEMIGRHVIDLNDDRPLARKPPISERLGASKQRCPGNSPQHTEPVRAALDEHFGGAQKAFDKLCDTEGHMHLREAVAKVIQNHLVEFFC